MREKYFLKLRGAIAGKGYNMVLMAQELNLSPQGLNEKLQGRNQFTLEEILKTCNWLEEPVDIFFDPKLHNLQFLEVNRSA